MKKLISFFIVLVLLFSLTSTAFAKTSDTGGKDNKANSSAQSTKQQFKLSGTPVIKYGQYKLPTAPITKGMDAKVSFDKKTAILIISKGNVEIVINLKKEVVYVDNAEDKSSGIFTADNNKKTIVMIKFIAKILGAKVSFNKSEVGVEKPVLDLPSNIVITTAGTTVLPNTLNSTTRYMEVSAEITAGQAAGGSAELYVGSKLVAANTEIAETDSSVTFTTSDGSPTNNELQLKVPEGGLVTVKLYDKSGNSVVSAAANPTLTVDYAAPVLAGINSATYDKTEGILNIKVDEAVSAGDILDVTKLTVYNSAKSYQLTNNTLTGSTGIIKSKNLITINLGSADREALKGFEGSMLYLKLDLNALIKDSAGNISAVSESNQIIPLYEISGLDAPANITITPVGTKVATNALNLTTQYMKVTANIKVGQAEGGKAELYVDSKLVAVDDYISPMDDTLTFTTSDGSPSNEELQKLIPASGTVSVRLYNALGESVISRDNPLLIADYAAPRISKIVSAVYDPYNGQFLIKATGVEAANDIIDVTKIIIFNSQTNSSYQLSDKPSTGSQGVVGNDNTIIITIGSFYKQILSSFDSRSMLMILSTGSIITDPAGNSSPVFTESQIIPVYDKADVK